ncbi:exported protein of unknown function [Methanoculleus bourgensis]|uniref:Uncharacterized protein n=1 Tax=Methanoculleus bourgensis TaxID=83986 RepID=A0A0X3BMT7_9EURY|nr:exported protein of unknown function [Methanoculleus bourgensis]
MKRSTPATLVAVSLLIIAGLLVAGCTTTQQETPGETTLTVFTAASLTGAFTDIGKATRQRTKMSRSNLSSTVRRPSAPRSSRERPLISSSPRARST